jgi:hypothetical protein
VVSFLLPSTKHNNDFADAMFLLKTKPFHFISGHLFHQILLRMRKLISLFKTFALRDQLIIDLFL